MLWTTIHLTRMNTKRLRALIIRRRCNNNPAVPDLAHELTVNGGCHMEFVLSVLLLGRGTGDRVRQTADAAGGKTGLPFRE